LYTAKKLISATEDFAASPKSAFKLWFPQGTCIACGVYVKKIPNYLALPTGRPLYVGAGPVNHCAEKIPSSSEAGPTTLAGPPSAARAEPASRRPCLFVEAQVLAVRQSVWINHMCLHTLIITLPA